MSAAPTHATVAGRAYLALQKKARSEGRATDELLQLFALEAFVARLVLSDDASDLVLKGGVLLAAYEMRRPTRDVDLSANNRSNSVDATLALVRDILSHDLDDGWSFAAASGDRIREEDLYSGVRVTVNGALASAKVTFHVDVNFGDPITPAPRNVNMPRLLGGTLTVRGYPLEMVHAEKIVTALQRGTANTRWRDFADIYLLSRLHVVSAADMRSALSAVAAFRGIELTSLRTTLDGFAGLGQTRWSNWVRRQRLQQRLPVELSDILESVFSFAEPLLVGSHRGSSWDPVTRAWL